MPVSSAASRPNAVLPWIRTVVRVGLGVVWIVAGATKIGDPAQSVAAVRAYEVLPDMLAQLLGWALPYLEILLGLVLISGLFTRWSAALSGLLQLAFVIGLIQAWARGLSIDCGCFSAGGQVAADQTSYPLDLARDMVFLAAAVWLFLQPVTRLSLDAVTGGFDRTEQFDKESA